MRPVVRLKRRFSHLPFAVYHLPFTRMALRHPPKEIIPPPERKKARGQRVVKFEQPPESFWRRWRRRLTRPFVIIPVIILTVVTVAVLAYYYHVFSQRIDRLLRGEVFTRSAGIYAAPRQIKAGDNV